MTQETSPASPDQEPIERLHAAAASHGVNLEQDRLEQLAKSAKSLMQPENKGYFRSGGLVVSPPIKAEDSSKAAAQIIFAPVVNGRMKIVPQREDISRVGLDGIRAVQDYVLLADAGFLRRPDTLVGLAHPSMSKLAQRFGFRQATNRPDAIEADYKTLAKKAFSPALLRAELRLAERQARAARGAGELASRQAPGGLASSYPMPQDQLAEELALLDSYHKRFPDAAAVINESLNDLKRAVGINIPRYRVGDKLFGVKDLDDEQGNVARIDTLPQASAVPGFMNTRLNLVMPSEEEIDAQKFATPAEENRARVMQDGITIVGDLPPEAREVIEGIYGLVGATVVSQKQTEHAGYQRCRVVREGEYQGVPVFFEEFHSLNNPDHEGANTFSYMLVDRETARQAMEA